MLGMCVATLVVLEEEELEMLEKEASVEEPSTLGTDHRSTICNQNPGPHPL